MKNINRIKLFAATVMMFFFCGRIHAQEGGVPQIKFISDIAIETLSYAISSFKYLPDNGYTPINMDLNDGIAGSDYVYLGYKLTTDPYDAITDIIVVEGDYFSGDQNRTFYYNGRTYHAAAYSPDSKGGNLNRGKEGAANLYFYYTKDRTGAGINQGEESLTVPNVIISKKHENSSEYAVLVFQKGNSEPSCDLNRGGGGKYIYLQLNKHKHERLGEMHSDGLYHCSCGVALSDQDDMPQKGEDGFYNIKNLGQLVWFRDFVNSSYNNREASARLINNIDMSPLKLFTPIASGNNYRISNISTAGQANGNGWSGTFDGNGCTISNININVSDGSPAAFISMGQNCTVKNLNLENASVKNSFKKPMAGSAGMETAAGILGCILNSAVIQNCSVSGTVGDADCDVAAGIAVAPSSITLVLEGCSNQADIVARNRTAGLFTISNHPDAYVYNPTLHIRRCINTGNVISYEADACATAYCPNQVSNCLNTGTIVSFFNVKKSTCPGTFIDFENFYSGSTITDNLVLSNIPLYREEYIQQVKSFITEENNYINPNSNELTSGQICYILNRESSEKENVAWHQKLGTDTYPTPHDSPYTVYKYRQYNDLGFVTETKYTNYGMFAHDVNNAPCEYDCIVQFLESDKATAFLELTCRICHKIEVLQAADLVSKTLITAPLCGTPSQVLYTYKTKISDTDIYAYYLDTEKSDLESRTEHADYSRDEQTGTNRCSTCGHIESDISSFEPYPTVNGIAQISKPGHLLYYALTIIQNPCDAILLNDIDLSNVLPYMEKRANVIPVLNSSTFDGNGYTVSGYNTVAADGNAGLFGTVYNSTVKNLTVEGYVSNMNNSALLCAQAINGSKIENCTTRGRVESSRSAGGICNTLSNSEIYGCRNYANIFSINSDMYCGGIAGTVHQNGSIKKSANYGKINGYSNTGGIVGLFSSNTGICDCANYGNIIAGHNTGGLYGSVSLVGNNEQISSFYNINVGQVTIIKETDSKGAVCGDVNIHNQHLELGQNYYMNVPEAVGTLTSGKIGTSNVEAATQEEFSNGTVCELLNRVDTKFFNQIDADFISIINSNPHEDNPDSTLNGSDPEMDYVNSNKAVWGMDAVNGTLYPSPFSDKRLYRLSLNNDRMYIIEGQVLDRLDITDGYYFNSPVTFTVKDLNYDASGITVSKKQYTTLRLPFDFSDPRLNIMQYCYYDSINGNLHFRKIDNTVAQAENNYLVRLADECSEDSIGLTIHADNAVINPSKSDFPKLSSDIPYMPTGFYGTYSSKNLNGDCGFYTIAPEGSQFNAANSNGSKISPFRAAFKYCVADTQHPVVHIIEDKGGNDDINSMDPVYQIDSNAEIYSPNGQKINILQSGINIIRLEDGRYIKAVF